MKPRTKVTNRRQGGLYVMLAALVAATVLSSALANSEILRIQRDPGQVPMANVNYSGWNYSPLDRINAFNVNNLEVKWTFQLGVTDSLERSEERRVGKECRSSG